MSETLRKPGEEALTIGIRPDFTGVVVLQVEAGIGVMREYKLKASGQGWANSLWYPTVNACRDQAILDGADPEKLAPA